MWGIFVLLHLFSVESRFIPTDVGNINQQSAINNQVTVHPHGCGEYTLSCYFTLNNNGSSPRMWGISKLDRTDSRWVGSSPRMWGIYIKCGGRFSSFRFIPTDVGNILPVTNYAVLHTVHPHGCGEYVNASCVRASGAGSSPRMWGIY